MKRKIRKLRGGGMDASKPDFKTPSTNKSVTKSPLARGNEGATNTSKNLNTGTATSNKVQTTNIKKTKVPKNNLSTGNAGKSNFSLPPIGPFSLAIKGFTAVEDARRAKRAKGEYFTSKKKIMPANRDFYRQYGRPLQTKVIPGKKGPDDDYLKEAGIIGTHKAPPRPKDDLVRCIDGTLPPCEVKTKTNDKTFKPDEFFKLEMNKGGGVPYGPPPKKGPNSEVPPVKLSRGGGAAIRGTKFKGVF
mgnify:CR=1 FL=1|jgi:hypothetical protein|tara:strand:- start:60 stop:797 length:738 start_codon:yes stop_codon:yes gene_type:complete